jgi:hypothetical protein
MPGVIVRLCPLAPPPGSPGQVNPLATSETTVLKTRFGTGDVGDPLIRSISVSATTECYEAEGDLHITCEYLNGRVLTSQTASARAREAQEEGEQGQGGVRLTGRSYARDSLLVATSPVRAVVSMGRRNTRVEPY